MDELFNENDVFYFGENLTNLNEFYLLQWTYRTRYGFNKIPKKRSLQIPSLATL